MNTTIFNETKRLLDKELDKCVTLLKETEDKWNNYIDLKLHDISYGIDCDFEHNGAKVHFDDSYLNTAFWEYCELEFDFFTKEWCAEENIDFNDLRDSVGRTSKFYLGKLHNNEKNKYTVALAEASQEFNFSSLVFFDKDDKIILSTADFYNLSEQEQEDYIIEMLTLIDSIYEDLQQTLNDIVKVYDHIADFKANQVENFKEYVKDSWLNNI
jgi:hypothetical protein